MGVVLVSLLLIEVGARVLLFAMGTDRSEVATRFRRQLAQRTLRDDRFTSHPYLVYRPSANNAGADAWGFRVYESDTPAAPTVITLGGSTTATSYPEQLFTYVNEAGVSVDVVNAGVAGWTTAEATIDLMLRGLEYDPDLIVMMQAYSDIYPSCAADFAADFSHWRGPAIPDIDESTAFDDLPQWMDNSGAYVALRWGLTFQRTRLLNDLAEGIQVNEAQFESCTFAGREAYRRNLISLIGIARAHNVDIVFVTEAHHVQDENNPTQVRMVAEADAHNAIMREVAAEYDVPLIDFAAAIEPRKADLMRRDLVHFDDDGYAVLAEFIGDWIMTSWED